MSPLLAYSLIGAGGAVTTRWCHLSRLIGGCMIVVGGVALAAPAFADEHVLARDNSEVACTMSKSGLTRVSLKDDRFASVSKLTTGVDSEDFTVVNEPNRGDIYVSVPEGYAQDEIRTGPKCDTSGLDENEAFAKAHGLNGTPVIVRSDGAVMEGFKPKPAQGRGPSKTFPNFTVDTGQYRAMGMQGGQVPALVLFDTVTKRPMPIGYGVMAADEVMDRIFTLTSVEPGSDF
jgi:hypothetical protein